MSPIACNLSAIGVAGRPRYDALVQKVAAAVRGRSESAHGYTFQLDGGAIRLIEVAEWMELERLCCPFLNLELAAAGGEALWDLRMSGPPGVKQILEAAFGADQ